MYEEILGTLKWFIDNQSGPFKKAYTGSTLSDRDKEKVKTMFIHDGLVEEDVQGTFGAELYYTITIDGRQFYNQVLEFKYFDAILKWLDAVNNRYANMASACHELKIPFSQGYEYKLLGESMIEVKFQHKQETAYGISLRGKHFIHNEGGYVHQFLKVFNQSHREINAGQAETKGKDSRQPTISIGNVSGSNIAIGDGNEGRIENSPAKSKTHWLQLVVWMTAVLVALGSLYSYGVSRSWW